MQSPRSLPVRVVRLLVGTLLMAAGLVGLVVPVVPGLLFILPGLAILAGEFTWARRLLDRARRPSRRTGNRSPESGQTSA